MGRGLYPYDDPRATDEGGVTVLHYAAHAGRDELFAWFVAADVAVDALDAYGCTALNYAATRPNAVAALLGLGASPDGGPGTDAPTWMRGRPLSLALRSSPECFELLLEAGADISWVPDACETAARRSAVLARLIARGSVPTAQALREAVRGWHFESVGLFLDAHATHAAHVLLAAGASVEAVDRAGRRPFEVAAESAVGPARKGLLELLMVTDVAHVESKSGFAVGASVTHAKFGEGVVETVEGEGDSARLTISYGEGRKTLLARFVTQRLGRASR